MERKMATRRVDTTNQIRHLSKNRMTHLTQLAHSQAASGLEVCQVCQLCQRKNKEIWKTNGKGTARPRRKSRINSI